MSRTHEMLEAYPRALHVEGNLLARTIDVVKECAITCTQCADALLAEHDVAPLVMCIRRNLDCADVCTTTARVISRQTGFDADVVRSQLEACVTACRICGDECERHAAHMAHCRVCSEVCRQCENACRALLAALR